MKTKIIPPSKGLQKKVKKIITELENKGYIGDEILEALYAMYDLLPTQLNSQVFNLSSGTSSIKTFNIFLNQLRDDFSKHRYYRDYSSPVGDRDLREVLSVFENINLGQKKYTRDNFIITDGATGALSHIFEAFKKYYSDKEILIPVPSYFAFKACIRQNNLRYKEVVMDIFAGKNTINPILKAINNNTKMIILCHPNNPTGLCFNNRDLEILLEKARKNKIIILSDEIFFDLYLLERKKNWEINKIALKTGTLNQLIVVKGLSKNYNLPGLRLGYLFTTDQKMVEYMKRNQLQRSFFASGSNFRNLFYIDCMIKTIDLYLKKYSFKKSIDLLKKEYNKCSFITKMSSITIKRIYKSYLRYRKRVLAFYNDNYNQINNLFNSDNYQLLPKEYAFNTFLKIKGVESINFFDFSLNLFLSTGIINECGPCFGLSQDRWQKDPYLGYWLRISFSRDLSATRKAINIFKQFINIYLTYPDKFLLTNKVY